MESKRIVQRTFSGHIRAVHLAAAKVEFDSKHATATLAACIVPVRGKAHPPIAIRSVSGQPIEEYYKWQFINAIVLSGLYPKDYVGVEVHFPKGNKGSAALKLDAAIFDDPVWVDHYNAYWADDTPSHLEWLNEHLIAVVEFKKEHSNKKETHYAEQRPFTHCSSPSITLVTCHRMSLNVDSLNIPLKYPFVSERRSAAESS